jgi:hypothetical protein
MATNTQPTKKEMTDQQHEAERARQAQHADVRPNTAPGSTTKGAQVTMGEPGSPSGPNEVDDGDGGARIPPEYPIPPGEDQPGLVGGPGIEGSGNVEPEPYPPDALTYPPIRDERADPPARMAARDERDNKNREARQAQRDNAAEGPRTEDRVADTLAQKKALLEVSEKASQERDQRGVDAREKDRELGDRQRSASRR